MTDEEIAIESKNDIKQFDHVYAADFEAFTTNSDG